LVVGATIAGCEFLAVILRPFSRPGNDMPSSAGYLIGVAFVALGVGLCVVGLAGGRH